MRKGKYKAEMIATYLPGHRKYQKTAKVLWQIPEGAIVQWYPMINYQ